MAWLLPQQPVRTFERNTLALVIAQLRFQPILRISESITSFQDKVRTRFPGYEVVETHEVEFGPLGVVNVRNERAHRFSADATRVLSVGSSQFTIEYSSHRNRNEMLSDVEMVIGALGELYAPVIPTRLGLRYVNLVQRSQIAQELNRELSWTDLLAAQFTQVPGGVTSLDDTTTFMAEVTDSRERGRMTLRYGIPATPAPNAPLLGPHFRLDTDRFVEGEFAIDEVVELLRVFSSDIFSLFMSATGPGLLEWMGSPKIEGGTM